MPCPGHSGILLGSIPAVETALRLYFNRSTHGDEPPYFLDFSIAHRDATVSPVDVMLERAKPFELVLNTVDHDRTAWIDPGIVRSLPVSGIRIRDVQG